MRARRYLGFDWHSGGESRLQSDDLDERLAALQRRAAIVGLAALVVAVIGAFLDAAAFFRAWLLAYLFWIALPLGALGLVALHHMVGGAWGFVVRRVLESAAATLGPMALLFLPIAVGAGWIYPWADEAAVAADPQLQHKALYLNEPFFLLRAVLYFGAWIVVAGLLCRWSRRQDEADADAGLGADLIDRMQLLSAVTLPLYGLTVTFASIDWAMSLEPHWYSTIYGMLFVVGQGLTTLAFAVIVLSRVADYPPMRDVVEPRHFHDLGNLTLAFVMLWAYMAYSQYLLIWAGNLPEEISWYLHRLEGGWQVFGPLLIGLHFAVPFLVLLSRRAKRDVAVLSAVAGGILALRLVDVFWLVKPAFSPGRFSVHVLDVVAVVAIGGLWLAAFTQRLRGWALLPLGDPRLPEAFGGEPEHGEAGGVPEQTGAETGAGATEAATAGGEV